MIQVIQLFFGLLALVFAFFVPGVGLGAYSAMTLRVQLNVQRLQHSGDIPDNSTLIYDILKGVEAASSPRSYYAISLAFLVLGVLLLVGSWRIGSLETKLAEAKVKLAAKEADAMASIAGPA